MLSIGVLFPLAASATPAAAIHGPATQGQFLLALGIAQRAASQPGMCVWRNLQNAQSAHAARTLAVGAAGWAVFGIHERSRAPRIHRLKLLR